MFEFFTPAGKQQVYVHVNNYISRHSKEFLNPIQVEENQVQHNIDRDLGDLDPETCWKNLLRLDKEAFMKGWKPATNQFDTLYDQLFHHYFDYPLRIEKTIHALNKPLLWFPPQWFEQLQPLASGRMGQVYISKCRLPTCKVIETIIREVNLCMMNQGNIRSCPSQVIGITATRSKQNQRSLAFVSFAADSNLECLIPQVDQWSFKKIFKTALNIASAVRALDTVHPNLQPKNILFYPHNIIRVVDGQEDWSHVPLSSSYGRYPYIAPEIFHDHQCITKRSNVYSLGIILWQLASGIIFPAAVPVDEKVYQLTPLNYMDPAYQALVVKCLARDPENRPSIDQICKALDRILTSETSTRQETHPLFVTQVREHQIMMAKYLASCSHCKEPLSDLFCGASISKRMLIQVRVSLDKLVWQQQHHHHRHVQHVTLKEEEHVAVDDSRSVRKKQKHHTTCHPFRHPKVKQEQRSEPSNTLNICGSDLPVDLMQVGFAWMAQ